MATHARLTSVDALEAFRASLIIFINKANSSLDQASDEVRRTRSWIQHDKRTYWENEVRRRTREFQQAEQELMSARMSKALDNLSTQQAAVHKAKRALEDAQDKMRKVKRWIRDYDGEVEPLSKGLNSLRGFLDHELPQALAYLSEVQRIMESYTEVQKPGGAPASAGSGAAPVEAVPAGEPVPAEPESAVEPVTAEAENAEMAEERL
jgi:archaellum component FlaC